MEDLSEFGAGLCHSGQGEAGKLTGAMSCRLVTPRARTEPDSGRTEASQADAGLLISCGLISKAVKSRPLALVDQTTWHQSPHLSRDFDRLEQATLERRLVTFRYCSNQGS